MARAAQSPEKFDEFGVPAGDAEGDLLEDGEGALAAAEVDRLGNVETLPARIEGRDNPRAQEIADIRN
ncbi:hypothetical protein [Bradyrhizobium niftali]|uniref:hypothetical protein n=1 Tax=Bradyrhizobium niftali TaxID=2560055 RepID=UPI00384DCB0B